MRLASNHALILFSAWCCNLCLPLALTQAQAVSKLPRAEYYLAKELYGAGRTNEAIEGFKTSIRLARQVGEQRWIDSIPPLIMLGECHYQHGNLALALEHYDAALTLALTYPGWIDQIEVGSEQLPDLDGVAKGINWFAKSTTSRSVGVPGAVQISIDPTQAQVDAQGTVVAPISLVTQLDATEVIRTLAIAMLRRWQVLGPLAQHSPLAEPLTKLFTPNPAQQATWVNASWSVLRGISRLSTRTYAEAAGQIRAGAILNNQLDYFMSPLALLALAELDTKSGNYQAAIVKLQDASLIAAEFEQHAELSESLRLLSSCAAASHRLELADPLSRAAAWCTKRSSMAFVSASLGAAELTVYAGNFSLADKATKQLGTILRSRDISLPRELARLNYIVAVAAFGQDHGAQGIASLDAALQLMHGSVQSGAVLAPVFQAQMTLDLLAGGALTAANAEALLAQTLAEPDTIAWELTPLECIALFTTSSLPAYERFLQLAFARGDQEQVLLRLDRLQRQRLYEALPMGGRFLCWRHGLLNVPAELPPPIRKIVEQTKQNHPEIQQASNRITALIEQLRLGPLPLDENQLTADEKKTFAELKDLSRNFENQVAFQSLLRKPMDRFLPGMAQFESLKSKLGGTDLVLAFAVAGDQVFGLAITKDGIESWQAASLAAVDAKLKSLLVEIGLVRQPAGQLPSAVLATDAAWRRSAADLLELLFPPAIQSKVLAAERVILAPSERLWYVPYELLPEQSKPGSLPWLAGRAVTYIPTLGSLPMAFAAKPIVKDTVAVVGNFFSIDKDSNAAQTQRLLDAIPNSHQVLITQKILVPSSTWLSLRCDQLWVGSLIPSMPIGWDTIVLPLGNSKLLTFRNWLETPQHAPAYVALPGLETSMSTGKLLNGNELFLPACSMLLGGTRSALLSRWPAGGKSSSALLQRYMEELQVASPSQALRRSTLAQWPEGFLIAEEPVLLPAGKESSAITSGAHPLLWSGYMSIGDTLTP